MGQVNGRSAFTAEVWVDHDNDNGAVTPNVVVTITGSTCHELEGEGCL